MQFCVSDRKRVKFMAEMELLKVHIRLYKIHCLIGTFLKIKAWKMTIFRKTVAE